MLEAWAYEKPVLMTAECNMPEGFTAAAAVRIGTSVEDISEGLEILFALGEPALTEMGRSIDEDPLFFAAPLAVGGLLFP